MTESPSAAGSPAGRRWALGSILRRLLAVVVALGLVGSGVMTAVAAGASTRTPVTPRMGAVAPLGQDLSGTLPNVTYGKAVGDFTGVGHDELAYVEDNQLKITDVRKSAGDVVRSTPTDLRATPNDGLENAIWPYLEYLQPWQADNRQDFMNISKTFGLTSVKVAASASNIYMAGATWDPNAEFPARTYALHLYKLPHDGSCAEASCAQEVVELPSTYNYPGFWFSRTNLVVVTSLATGVVGGRTLIAVGLSDRGIYIYAQDPDGLHLVGIIDHQGIDGDASWQTPVTALAFGPPSGPGQGGLLAAGEESTKQIFFMYRLNPDGSVQSMFRAGGWAGGPQYVSMVAGFARIDGRLVYVFSREDGLLFLMNPETGLEITNIHVPGQPTGVAALTPWDGSPDNQDLVVAMLGGTDEVLRSTGSGFRPVPIIANGTTTATAEQTFQWFPGYGAGRLEVLNLSAGPVDIAMASRPDPDYGCWLDASVASPPVPAFPDFGTPLAAGAASAHYFAGALTAGAGGDCASALPGSKSEHAAYVIITPAGDRADEHIVKLTAGANGELKVASQVGGYLAAALVQLRPGPGSWGTWQLIVHGGSRPRASAAPDVAGFRLTAPPGDNYEPPSTGSAADDPCRPVFRFDVTGARWTHVAAAGQVTGRVPAMTVQGSTNGLTWQDLGQLMPSAAPAYAPSPAHPDDPDYGTVTLGPASFYWQNPPGTATAPGVVPKGQPDECPATGSKPLTEVRVVSGGKDSQPVRLANLQAPPINGGSGATPVSGVTATPDAAGGIATPRADGVNQAGLTVKLIPSGSGEISPSDPRYQLVYYRVSDTHALVTGLYEPGGYADYIAVGRYDADGSAARQTHSFLVTTSTAAQSLTPVMNDTGTVKGAKGSPFLVAASGNPLTAAGIATSGISVTGCAANPGAICPLSVPAASTPALFQAGGPADGPVSGLQFSAMAITGRVSLPLQTGTANVHQLGSAPLVVTAAKAQLTDTSSFFPADTIDTALVTSGELVPALSIPVGNGR